MKQILLTTICVLFAASTAAQVVVTPDVDYIAERDYADRKDRLDIYAPRGARSAPVVLMIHGGGLTGGDRKGEADFARRLADEGFVAVAISHRLSPGVSHPSHVQDLAAAFAWVKRNIARHGGHPERIVVAGYSAGGYLAALLGADARYLAAHGLSTKHIAGLALLAPTFEVARRPSNHAHAVGRLRRGMEGSVASDVLRAPRATDAGAHRHRRRSVARRGQQRGCERIASRRCRSPLSPAPGHHAHVDSGGRWADSARSPKGTAAVPDTGDR
jgi:acetyl esterase/lipase